MATFQDYLNEITPALNEFAGKLESQLKQTNLKEFFTAKQLFAQYQNVYQLLIEGLLLMVSAVVAIVVIEAVASIVSALAMIAALGCALYAGYQVLVNKNSEGAKNWSLYCATAVAFSSLTAIIAPLLYVASIALMSYKSSDLIKSALPKSFRENSFDTAKHYWGMFSNKVDDVQASITNFFNPGVKV